jgi:hypothetical protein
MIFRVSFVVREASPLRSAFVDERRTTDIEANVERQLR